MRNKKSSYICINNNKQNNIMNYEQAVKGADKALDKSLEALNNGQLSEYVRLQKQVDYLNGVAESLKNRL